MNIKHPTLSVILLALSHSVFAAVNVDDSPKTLPFNMSLSGKVESFTQYNSGTNASGESYYFPAMEVDAYLAFNAQAHTESTTLSAYGRIDLPNSGLAGSNAGNVIGNAFYVSIENESLGELRTGILTGATNHKWIWMPGGGVYSFNGYRNETSALLSTALEDPELGGNANAYVYLTPEFEGLSAAASFTPIRYSRKERIDLSTEQIKAYSRNIFELQVLYSEGSARVGAGVSTHTPAANSNAHKSSWNLLAAYDFGSVVIGAGTIHHALFNSTYSQTSYVGVDYTLSEQWTIGGGYLAHDIETPDGRGLIIANANYRIMPGATWTTGLHWPTSGKEWSLGTGLSYSFKHRVH